jgi:hypothetical protein
VTRVQALKPNHQKVRIRSFVYLIALVSVEIRLENVESEVAFQLVLEPPCQFGLEKVEPNMNVSVSSLWSSSLNVSRDSEKRPVVDGLKAAT